MRIFKQIFGCIVLALSVCNIALADISPDLIDIDYKQGEVKISPDGKYLALALINEEKRTLAMVETATFKAVGGVNFGKMQDVGNFFWATDKRLVVEILHRTEWDDEAKFYGELYSVDYNGKHGEMIYGYRAGEKQVGSARKKKKSIYGWARVVSLLPHDKKNILISSTEMPGGSELFDNDQKRDQVRVKDMSKLYSTVHRLNIHNGKMTPAYTRSPLPNTVYFTDKKGELAYAIGGENAQSRAMFRFSDDEWKKIALGEATVPLGFDAQYQHAYYLKGVSGEQCLFKIALKSGDAQQASEQCELGADKISISADHAHAYAMHVQGDKATYQVFDKSTPEAEFFASIVDVFAGFQIEVTSGSADGSYWVVRAIDEANEASFYLYNGKNNEFARLM